MSDKVQVSRYEYQMLVGRGVDSHRDALAKAGWRVHSTGTNGSYFYYLMERKVWVDV